MLTNSSCLFLSQQLSPLTCPHPSTCMAADLDRGFLHVVMTGQTAVLSRGVSCFPSLTPSTSCSLIFTQYCFLQYVFFCKQLLFNLTELGWSSFKDMRARGSFPAWTRQASLCQRNGGISCFNPLQRIKLTRITYQNLLQDFNSMIRN